MEKVRLHVQRISKADYKYTAAGFPLSIFLLLLVLFSLLAVTGCMPLKDESINTELFTDKYEMKERASHLKRGMTKAEAFEALNVPLERFSTMTTAEVQMAVYGNSLVQGTPQQLEDFRKRLLGFEGYSLPYRYVESNGTLGFGKMQIDRSGHDLKLIMVFDQGRLMKSNVVGEQDLKASEDQYFWNSLLKTGVGSIL